jgi:DNA-binding beta-propeller fold protein YncE
MNRRHRPLPLLPAALLAAVLAPPASTARAAPPPQTVTYPQRTLQRDARPRLRPQHPAAATPAPAATLPPRFVVTNVEVGQLPIAAVISPDERWAYVLGAASGEIDVLDLTTSTLARRVHLPFFMDALQISPAGDELYVAAAAPPLTGYPTDGSCPQVALPLTSSAVLFIDTASLAITGRVPVPNLIIDLVLSPDATTLAASTFAGLVLIDLRTRTSIEIPTTGHQDQQAAVFASQATRVFAVHSADELSIFDLAGRTATAAVAPPGLVWFGNNVSATPGGDKVFVDACGPTCAMAVLDAQTAAVLKVIPDASQDAGLLVTRDGRRAFLPDTAILLDLGSLAVLGNGQLPGFGGVAGVLSPDESLLYVRPSGGLDFSLVGYGAPVSYDLGALDTASLHTVAYKVLDQRQISCSWASPLRMSRSGRRLVAPNPTLNTVSLITVDNAPPAPCVPGIFSLCLGNGRFQVTATYRTASGQSGAARAAPLTPDTGAFWFFSAANLELLVKVLNGCAVNGSYWAFAAGLTDVNVELTVTDTQTNLAKTYTNPQATAFRPVQDTGALPVCP